MKRDTRKDVGYPYKRFFFVVRKNTEIGLLHNKWLHSAYHSVIAWREEALSNAWSGVESCRIHFEMFSINTQEYVKYGECRPFVAIHKRLIDQQTSIRHKPLPQYRRNSRIEADRRKTPPRPYPWCRKLRRSVPAVWHANQGHRQL